MELNKKIELLDKYAPLSESGLPENKNKFLLSDDVFAICEFIDALTKKIERKMFIK